MSQELRDLLSRAIAQRSDWGLPLTARTDCYRLVDGGADGLRGIELEVLAGHWVVGTRGVRWPEGMERVALELGARSVWWKDLAEEKRKLEWRAGERVAERFVGLESGLSFEFDLSAGYSQGLFLDQRLNRLKVAEVVAGMVTKRKGAGGEAPRVLNTFAYTGGFSVAAAAAGAATTTLDLSQPYLDWAKDNFRANGLDPEEHFWVKGDAGQWLARWAKAGRAFDGIVLDPPTFSRRGKKTWLVERDLGELVGAACQLLTAGGWILVSSNSRQLDSRRFLELLRSGGGRSLSWQKLRMPPEFCGEDYLRAAWGSD